MFYFKQFRVEKRRNILITSLRFFRLVSEYFDKTGEVFDSLVMGSDINDFNTASLKLLELQENQLYLGELSLNNDWRRLDNYRFYSFFAKIRTKKY